MRRFCLVFPSKLSTSWHIFEVSFDRKCIKSIDILIFIMENQTAFIVFLSIGKRETQFLVVSCFKSPEKFSCPLWWWRNLMKLVKIFLSLKKHSCTLWMRDVCLSGQKKRKYCFSHNDQTVVCIIVCTHCKSV